MPRSMLKFFADRGGPQTEHGGNLHWPGTVDGFPFRGDAVPDLKQREMADMALAMDYKSRLFRLWEAEEKREFDFIMDRIVNGWYMQHRRDDKWIAEENHYTVWLEWAQIYGETPNSKTPGGPADGQSVTIRPGTEERSEASQRRSVLDLM
jgi:hypothetical protein